MILSYLFFRLRTTNPNWKFRTRRLHIPFFRMLYNLFIFAAVHPSASLFRNLPD